MKNRKALLAVVSVLLLTLVFVILPASGGCAAKPAEAITVDFVTFTPLANEIEYQFFKREFIDVVNERAKGELIINVRGGPEVIPGFDLGVAVQKGTIDMANIPTAFFESLVPGADSTKLSIYTAWEERENNIYEYIVEMYKKAGLYYLGRPEASKPHYFHLYVSKRIEKPEDFAGLKFGGSTAFHGHYKRLGAKVTTLAIPEYHSAMERGVVDGVDTSIFMGMTIGLQEVSKYLISHGFYRATPSLPINLDTWNQIPKHLQELMIETMAEFERKFYPYEDEQHEVFLKKHEEAGVELLTFPPEMEEWFIEAANEGSWDYALERFPGDVIPKLREKITK